MRRECIQAVNKAAGRVLSETELKRLKADILKEYKETSNDLPNAERLRLAGVKAQDNMNVKTAKLVHEEISNFRKIEAIDADVMSAPEGMRSQAFSEKLVVHGGSPTTSTEANIHALKTENTKGLSKLKKKHKKEIKENLDFERDVLSLLLNQDVDNPVAKKFVEEYRKSNSSLLQQAQENNINVTELKNRIPHNWDATKLATTGVKQYIDRMHEVVNKDHIAYKKADGSRQSDEWFSEFFRNSYDSITESRSDILNSPHGGKVGAHREHHRQIHLLEDPDVHLEVQKEFGSTKHIVDTLIHDLSRFSTDVVMARDFGTRAESTIKKLIQKYHKADRDATDGLTEVVTWYRGNKIDRTAKRLEAVTEIMLHGETIHNAVWAARHANIRALLSAAQLGGHVIAALFEDGFLASQMLKRQGISPEAYMKFKKLSVADRVSLASEVGVLCEHGVAVNSRVFGVDSGATVNSLGFGGELAEKMHKWSGSEWLDNKRKAEYQLAVSEQTGKLLDKYETLTALLADEKVHPDLKKFMKQFDETDFHVMKHSEKVSSPEVDWNMRSSKTIRDAQDAVLKDIVDQRVKDANPVYVEKLAEHDAKRQRKIDAEASRLIDANAQKIQKYDKTGQKLEADIPLVDKAYSKEVKTKTAELKKLDERMASELKIKQKESKDIIKPAETKIGVLEKEKVKIQDTFDSNETKIGVLFDAIQKLEKQRDTVPKSLLDKKAFEEFRLKKLLDLKKETFTGKIHLLDAKALKKIPEIKSNLKIVNAAIESRKVGFDNKINLKKEKIKPLKTEQENIKNTLSAKDKEIGELKSTIDKHKNPTINLALVKERMALHERLYDLSSAAGRNRYLSKVREKAHAHTTGKKTFIEKLDTEKQKKLKPLEEYKSEEMQSIQKHLDAEFAKEASRIKNAVANKWNAILATNTQTALKGASGASLRDKYRLGLLTHKKGSFAGELCRYTEQYITTPINMLFNALDLYSRSISGQDSSMNLQGIGFQYVATMAVAGAATATVKAILRGEDPTCYGALVDGILTNGALIPYGEAVYSLLTEGDPRGFVGAVPSAVTNMGTAITKAIKGKKGAGVATVRSVRNVVPFMNMWYTKSAFDHIVLNNILEIVNPGYNERSQRKQEKHGKGFFWNKNEMTPNRIPEPKIW